MCWSIGIFNIPPPLRAYLKHLATCIFLARGVGNLMQRSCVYPSVSCTIILSVVYYPVSCALLGHLCNLSVSCMLQVAVGSCASLGQLCIFLPVLCHSVGCMITLSVMYYSVSCVLRFPISCALLGQLCTSLSVVHYSISCVLTRSVVSDSVSCVTLSQLDDNSVSCLLLRQLCIIPSLVYYSLRWVHFSLSPFLFLKHFQTSPNCRLLNWLKVLSRKFFQTWEYYPQNC